MRQLLCLSLLLLPVAADDKPAEDPRVMKPGDAPTPFTADEIRKAFPVGRTDVFRIEGGDHVMTMTNRVLKSGEKEVEIERAAATDGKESPAAKKTSTWREMQAHGAFPKASTTITEETIEVPAGKFECLVYAVNRGPTKCTMYFAKKLPGPPVKMTMETQGKVDSTMVLVEHKEPAAEKPAEEEKPAAGEKPAEGEKPAGD
jgi:hypothetical protein